MLERSDAALLIGDPALKLAISREPESLGYHTCDLAREWFAWTGLPFVFALWAVRAEVAAQYGSWLVARFQQAREGGLRNLDEIVARWSRRLDLAESEIRGYLKDNVEYYLGSSHEQGLRHFFELCFREGLIDRPELPAFIHVDEPAPASLAL
jgi:chorismate dehydratase